jgi:hypothetical protein
MSKSPTDKIGVETDFNRTDADTRYRVLANEDRQTILHVLEATTTLTLDELTEEVVARKRDSTSTKQTRIALVHQHLPLLEDAGVVQYDRETEHITHCESTLEELLRLL